MKNCYRFLHCILPLFFLNACSSMNENFDCPAGKGLGCMSVSDVHRHFEGAFSDYDTDQNNLKTLTKAHPAEDKGDLHMWIAPYYDDKGVLHDERRIVFDTTLPQPNMSHQPHGEHSYDVRHPHDMTHPHEHLMKENTP